MIITAATNTEASDHGDGEDNEDERRAEAAAESANPASGMDLNDVSIA